MTILPAEKRKRGAPVCWVCGAVCAFGKPAAMGTLLAASDPHRKPDMTRKCSCGRKGVLPVSGVCERCTFVAESTFGARR